MISEEAIADLATLLYKDGGLVLGDDRPDGGGEGGEEEEVEEDQKGHNLGLEVQQDVLGVGERGSHHGFEVGGREEVVRGCLSFESLHFFNTPVITGLFNAEN